MKKYLSIGLIPFTIYACQGQIGSSNPTETNDMTCVFATNFDEPDKSLKATVTYTIVKDSNGKYGLNDFSIDSNVIVDKAVVTWGYGNLTKIYYPHIKNYHVLTRLVYPHLPYDDTRFGISMVASTGDEAHNCE
jgi:hypothetical protein